MAQVSSHRGKKVVSIAEWLGLKPKSYKPLLQLKWEERREGDVTRVLERVIAAINKVHK